MVKKSCYMCDEKGTTKEHVPPKCLFPERKDLPPEVDLRKGLITVPACPDHNTHKSLDDEYLRYVLVVNILSNKIALNQFLTKVIRAIEKSPKLMQYFYKNSKKIIIENIETGKLDNTVAFATDRDRFDKIIKMLSRALYFDIYKKKWLDEIYVHPDFLISLDPQYGRDDNKYFSLLVKEEDRLFADQPCYGANPDVFKFQLLEAHNFKLLRLNFYDGCKVLVSFGLQYGIFLEFLQNFEIIT